MAGSIVRRALRAKRRHAQTSAHTDAPSGIAASSPHRNARRARFPCGTARSGARPAGSISQAASRAAGARLLARLLAAAGGTRSPDERIARDARCNACFVPYAPPAGESRLPQQRTEAARHAPRPRTAADCRVREASGGGMPSARATLNSRHHTRPTPAS
ncbi:hypothetical protein J4764_25200 [Burkholderia pseudomallei]|uniref:hypothetical protein n=1 Tax=Burkholderia pseudomallei TaxID=28450 RepID=UPI001AAFDCEE|nr:hypothetical protein [Burkholderia pseudomallei]